MNSFFPEVTRIDSAFLSLKFVVEQVCFGECFPHLRCEHSRMSLRAHPWPGWSLWSWVSWSTPASPRSSSPFCANSTQITLILALEHSFKTLVFPHKTYQFISPSLLHVGTLGLDPQCHISSSSWMSACKTVTFPWKYQFSRSYRLLVHYYCCYFERCVAFGHFSNLEASSTPRIKSVTAPDTQMFICQTWHFKFK